MTTNLRKIGLLGYPAEYFLPFARSLEEVGFEVYWIVSLNSDEKFLIRNGVAKDAVLNVQFGLDTAETDLAKCRRNLHRFEQPGQPRFNDIIMMDRLLRLKSPDFSIRFMSHVSTAIDQFLQDRGINFITSWRDTCVQMAGMLVAKKRNVPFVIPTRIRIPQEMYGFCTEHTTDSFVQLRSKMASDEDWARKFVEAYQSSGVKPALKKSTRSFLDVLRLMPSHARAFWYELRRSFADYGNDYTRYPIPRLIKMYFVRRMNLIRYKISNPCQKIDPATEKFALYTLHTQPESSVDVQASYFSDQFALVKLIARSLPASHLLYVKVHPTDVDGKARSYYDEIKLIPNIRLVDFSVDTRHLILKADLIFALTGTVAYEAGLLGRPVIVFAKNYFNSFPTVAFCENPVGLPALIESMMEASFKDKNSTRAEIEKLMASLRACCFEGEVSRTYGASNEGLRKGDLLQLQVAYEAIFRFLRSQADKRAGASL